MAKINNYGLRTRDIVKAGKQAMRNEAKNGKRGYTGAKTTGERWSNFGKWVRENHGVRFLEKVEKEHVVEYGKTLAAQVENGQITASTAQNNLSAVNTVMTSVRSGDWQTVSPTKDCNIEKRSNVRTTAPTADKDAVASAVASVAHEVSPRAAAVVELARELGLRSKEASLLNAQIALKEARETGLVSVKAGTKGGRARTVPVTEKSQITALERSAAAQSGEKSMIPAEKNWKSWRAGELRQAREILQRETGGGLHDLRAAYACARYSAITNAQPPVFGGIQIARDVDEQARLTISKELGHNRVDVTTAYIGGRS